jgi:hypothetical protein
MEFGNFETGRVDHENHRDHFPHIKAGDFVFVQYGVVATPEDFRGRVKWKLPGSLTVVKENSENETRSVLPRNGITVQKTTASQSVESSPSARVG